MSGLRGVCVALGVGSALCAPPSVQAGEPDAGTAVATTAIFAFHSDFATNLNDALIQAGRARAKAQDELFRGGAEASCFTELPRSARAGWDRAVDYYAEIISPADWSDRQQYLIRLELAHVEEGNEAEDRRFLDIARGFRAAATPAYAACRWPTQDAENRHWVEQLVPQLQAHEQAIAARLAELYHQPLGGLPIRVDVVETVNWSGATTILLDPAGGHILISNEAEPGPASLELVFHEASHTLMGRNHPVRQALQQAAEKLEVSLPRDLWHGVLFYTTGDAVRRVLAQAGQPAYVPMMFSGNIFKRYHEALQRAWPAYMEGRRTLEQAAEDLLRALDHAPAASP